MSRQRVLLIIAALALFLLVVIRLVFTGTEVLDDVPSSLIGTWTSTNERYTDRYITIKEEMIEFGTGGTSFTRYALLGVTSKPSQSIPKYVLHFRDAGGTDQSRTLLYDSQTDTFVFVNQEQVLWTRLSE